MTEAPIFEEVWKKAGGRQKEHSIIRVPKNQPIIIEYSKPRLGLFLQIWPIEELRWSVQGLVDGDTVANLGFHITSERRGLTPPVVTDEDIEAVRQFGSVWEVPGIPSLWQVKLDVPVNNIYAFLDRVWNPQVDETPDPRRLWHLTKVGVPYRDIPQKDSDKVGLRVIPQ